MSKPDIRQNAGRCDICGSHIEMESGDRLCMIEFDADDIDDELDISDQDVADGVADALERVGDDGADYDLAQTIREEHEIGVHSSCLDQTAYSKLEQPAGSEPKSEGSVDE